MFFSDPRRKPLLAMMRGCSGDRAKAQSEAACFRGFPGR
jgi:hypothetical protein